MAYGRLWTPTFGVLSIPGVMSAPIFFNHFHQESQRQVFTIRISERQP
jgi:hypothetical protein